jgi:tRNA(fMet)-specific endonuclease VapC
MYMLDTNICIYVLNHHSDRLRYKFKAVKNMCISAVTNAELCFGVEHGKPSLKRQRREQLLEFARLLLVETLGPDVGWHYGRVRSQLKQAGRLIGNNDLFIAAHALSLGAVLVTNNVREFTRVPDLTVENWL